MRAVIKSRNLNYVNFRKLFSRRIKFLSSIMESQISNLTVGTSLSSEHCSWVKKILKFIPRLTTDLHKGQCGRIGVVGGSIEYTGAPYFAALSSLKVGADLVYVFCCREAAPVIKSYSPELIVHPVLESAHIVKDIEQWLGRLHALVIGPGLGRNQGVLKNVKRIITHCQCDMDPPIPLIIDADGLFLINEDLSLISNYKGPVFLTPNQVEFNKLKQNYSEAEPLEIAKDLNAVIIQKGLIDVITNGIYNDLFNILPHEATFLCDSPGSNRRCGGQGDILSGCLATLVAWLQLHLTKSHLNFNDIKSSDSIFSDAESVEWTKDEILSYSLPAYGACLITKAASRLAYEEFGRGMTATEMIQFVPKAFKLYFNL